jgi:hypothetical protein
MYILIFSNVLFFLFNARSPVYARSWGARAFWFAFGFCRTGTYVARLASREGRGSALPSMLLLCVTSSREGTQRAEVSYKVTGTNRMKP